MRDHSGGERRLGVGARGDERGRGGRLVRAEAAGGEGDDLGEDGDRRHQQCDVDADVQAGPGRRAPHQHGLQQPGAADADADQRAGPSVHGRQDRTPRQPPREAADEQQQRHDQQPGEVAGDPAHQPRTEQRGETRHGEHVGGAQQHRAPRRRPRCQARPAQRLGDADGLPEAQRQHVVRREPHVDRRERLADGQGGHEPVPQAGPDTEGREVGAQGDEESRHVAHGGGRRRDDHPRVPLAGDHEEPECERADRDEEVEQAQVPHDSEANLTYQRSPNRRCTPDAVRQNLSHDQAGDAAAATGGA